METSYVALSYQYLYVMYTHFIRTIGGHRYCVKYRLLCSWKEKHQIHCYRYGGIKNVPVTSRLLQQHNTTIPLLTENKSVTPVTLLQQNQTRS